MDSVGFIKTCIRQNRIFWTYHVNMRLGVRSISRQIILDAVDSFEVIEEYPKDKYLPSYLIRGEGEAGIFHAVMAIDLEAKNVRIVTAYYPDQNQWSQDFRKRSRA